MSDLHARPLRGRDLPEAEPPRLRQRAHVYHGANGWYWAHGCAPRRYAAGDFPYLTCDGACNDALRHLKECCK